MAFAGMNHVAVFVAALAGWLTGAVWYSVLKRPWLAALDRTQEEIAKKPGSAAFIAPFVIAAISSIVMAWTLAGVTGHLGPGQVTVGNGMITAAFLWLGFVLTTTAVTNAFSARKWMLTAIDTGHWLAALLVMGAIIGAMGV